MGGSNICFAQNWQTERSSESILIFAGPVHHEECCLPEESSWPSLSVFGWRPLTSNGLVLFDGWFGWFGYCGNGSKAIQYPRGWRLTRTHLMLVIWVFSTPHKCLGSAARENLGNGRRSVDSDVIHHFYPLKEKDSGDWMTIKPQGDAPSSAELANTSLPNCCVTGGRQVLSHDHGCHQAGDCYSPKTTWPIGHLFDIKWASAQMPPTPLIGGGVL